MNTERVTFFRDCDGDVFAVFPDSRWSKQGDYIAIYQHVGQHGDAWVGYVDEQEQAEPEEYAELLTELQGIYGRSCGPDDPPVQLVVVSREDW